MKYQQTKPCKQCPFRRKSCPGWLGDSTPEEFVETTLGDAAMPCHSTVDYESEGWQADMAEPNSTVQHCAGARIFFANQCKLSKNPVTQLAKILNIFNPVKADKENVFTNADEFLTHHNKFKRK